jgi:ligand-binding sensor domain-containing protein/signal transduction histidine kinase
VAVLGIIWLASAAFALDPARTMSQYVHDEWRADRGFVGGEVYAISQSADGYLWIGTERGLVRFDGFQFTLIQQPLSGSPRIGPVRGLVSDAEGNLWIRLEGSRLLLYRDGRFQDADNRFDLQEITFTAAALDYEGNTLLSGLGDRTFQYHDGHLHTVVSAEQNPGTIISLAGTRDGKIWLGTRDNGLFRVSGEHISKVAEQLKDAKINVLLPASSGGLWIGTDYGLQFWDGNRLVALHLPPSIDRLQILAMVKDHDANVWVGTDHGILRITSSGAGSLDQLHPNAGHEVTAIFEDRDGDIWFGGKRGIERLRNGMFTTYATAQGLPSDSNGPIYVDPDGRTWFAPLTGGLYWMKNGQVKRVSMAGLNDDVIYSIAGCNGEILAGRQRGGLTVLTTKNNSFRSRTYTQADGLGQNNVYSVACTRDGTVWAGTVSSGVSKIEAGKLAHYSEADGLPSNTINSIVEGFDRTIWIATPAGLASFAEGHWKNYSARDGLPSSNVRTIFEDRKHDLWIATSDGLAYRNAGHIRAPQKLPEPFHEQIQGIAEDGMGSLWFVTSDHVLQVNRDRLLGGPLDESDVESYGIGDGLEGFEGVGRDRTMVGDPLGRIWVSMNRGLSVADPEVTSNNSVPVMARIESVLAGGAPVDLQRQTKFPAGTESIIFNYAGTNLATPERIRFRSRLDGVDGNWSNASVARQVVYRSLGPGSYRFHVIASNASGLWNGPETSVSFVIQPAFWQAWWFRLICLAGCGLVIVGIYRLRMYRLTRQLNIRFQERLAERMRIAQELHDTLLQGVLSASLQLDVAEEQVPENSPAKPRLQRVLQLLAKVTEEGRNALRGLRSPETDHGNLETAFSKMRQEFAVEDKPGYRVIASNTPRPVRPMIRDQVYRIGREAIANAFVHAKANSVEVEVDYAGGYLRLLVRDDGRGIDPYVLHSGRDGHWGLPGMRERSECIGASLKVRSRIGAGTEVELTVPGAIAFENGPHRPMSRWLTWLSRERFEASVTDRKKRVQK